MSKCGFYLPIDKMSAITYDEFVRDPKTTYNVFFYKISYCRVGEFL